MSPAMISGLKLPGRMGLPSGYPVSHAMPDAESMDGPLAIQFAHGPVAP